MKYFKYKYISLIVMDLGIPNQSEKRFERKLNTNRRIVLFFFYQIFAIFDDFFSKYQCLQSVLHF